MNEDKRIVEINGVRMEVDLRTARIIENYRVGDSVKLLKKRYGTDYDVLPAAIVGFTEFRQLPTIELLALRRDGSIEFFTFNAKTEDVEIAPFNRYEVTFERAAIMELLDTQVNKAREELRLAEAKRKAFVECFAKVFENEMVGAVAQEAVHE